MEEGRLNPAKPGPNGCPGLSALGTCACDIHGTNAEQTLFGGIIAPSEHSDSFCFIRARGQAPHLVPLWLVRVWLGLASVSCPPGLNLCRLVEESLGAFNVGFDGVGIDGAGFDSGHGGYGGCGVGGGHESGYGYDACGYAGAERPGN